MSAKRKCPKCGAEGSSDALQGLCPACVIRVTLASLASENPVATGLNPGGHASGGAPESAAGASPAGNAAAGTRRAPLPRLFGDYELIEELAHGGMGVVWRARQISLNRIVAVKMIRAGLLAGDMEVKRFHAEAEAAASLDHPNIVPLYEVGEHGGQHFFSLKLIEGGSLAGRSTGGRWFREHCPAHRAPSLLALGRLRCCPTAAALMAKVARAVHYAHQRGLIHRDLKPGNILLDAQGEPHVTDFGLAKQVESSVDLTLTGAVLGTPSYMSPEQATGQAKHISTATDIYSLGAILYELLAGRPPFQADTPLETLRQVVEDEPVPPSQVARQRELRVEMPGCGRGPSPGPQVQPLSILRIDRDLETICLKCLEKDPARRYGSAQALAEDLERWLGDELILARRSTAAERVVKWTRRHPGRAAGIAALLLMLAAGVFGISWEWRRAENKAEESRQRLVRMDLANGMHHIRDDDLPSALPWFVEALRLDERYATRNVEHRTRLGTLLRQAPQLVQLWSHEADVNGAEFSPDGRYVLTASADQTARVWDALTGLPVTPHLAHGAGVASAVFSPDGRRVATACEDGMARVWNAQTGEPLTPPLRHRVPGEGKGPNSVIRFSGDGNRLLTALASDAARLWSSVTGEAITPPLRHRGAWVVDAVLSPDGRHVLTAGSDGTARYWDAATGEPAGPTLELGQRICCVAFNAQRTSVITGGEDGLARIWDAATGTPVGLPLRHARRVSHAEFNPMGTRVVTASLDATARVWDARTGEPITPPFENRASVFHATFSPDGLRVVTASHAQVAAVWDASTGRLLFPPLWHANIVKRAGFSPDGRRVLTASADGTARLWNLETRAYESVVLPGAGNLKFAWFTPDRRRLISVGENHRVQVWDAATGKALSPPLPLEQRCDSAALSPDGERLVTGSQDHRAQVWHVTSGKRVSAFRHSGSVRSVAWRPDGRAVISAADDVVHGAHIWDADSGAPIAPLLPHNAVVNHAGFSPDGQRIATASNDKTARVWDARTGQPVTPPLRHAEKISRVEFSPDGQRVATVSRDGTARIWDATTGRELTPPLRHGNWVNDVAFSPDGRRVMTASDDGTARVWTAGTGAPLSAPLRLPGGLWAPQFSRDGRRVLAHDGLGAQVWEAQTGLPLTPPLDPHVKIGDACFSPDERQVLMAARDGRILAWDITPIDWPVEDLEAAAQLLTSRRIDVTEALVPLDQAQADGRTHEAVRVSTELQRAWERLRARHPDYFSAP